MIFLDGAPKSNFFETGRWNYMTLNMKPHFRNLWMVFLRLGSSSSCSGLSLAQILPEKIKKIFLPKKLGFIDVLRTALIESKTFISFFTKLSSFYKKDQYKKCWYLSKCMFYSKKIQVTFAWKNVLYLLKVKCLRERKASIICLIWLNQFFTLIDHFRFIDNF